MRARTRRQPSSENPQDLSSFSNQTNGYPVLSDSDLERFLGSATNGYIVRTEGSILFAEGQKALGIYVVWEGRVKVSIGSDSGKSFTLGLAGRGAVLGLPATILGLRYAATAEAVEPVKMSFFSRDDLLRRLRATETAAYAAAESLSATCYSVMAQFKAIQLSQSAEQKMARFLLRLPSSSVGSNGRTEVTLAASQEEIGQMIGVCRETVTRVIARFKKRRIIESGTSAVIIHDRAALERIAEFQESGEQKNENRLSDPLRNIHQ